MKQVTNVTRGYRGTLVRHIPTHLPREVVELQFYVQYVSRTTVRFQVTDPGDTRWQVPIPLNLGSDTNPSSPGAVDYDVYFLRQPFAFRVVRRSDEFVLFDTSVSAPLLFADQFLELSTSVNVSSIYGIGERRHRLRQPLDYSRIGLWTHDHPPKEGVNMYGVHNFAMALSTEGAAYGIFFLNSNAQEVVLQPGRTITYRTTGGILDFFIFTGPTPADVYRQYQTLIGFPTMPAYWHLGFHLSRYHYQTLDDLIDVFQRNYETEIPYDTQWNDIDYMDNLRDWTYDRQRFAGLPNFVKLLHGLKMYYIPIVDPGISVTSSNYPPYKDGLNMNVFVKDNRTGSPLLARAWPGVVVFPDFSHPNASAWWYKCASTYYNTIPFDGLWIDVNEPANFVDGSTTGCTNSSLDNPPFTPNIESRSMLKGSLCPSSMHYLTTHYNFHSLYAYFEARVTHEILPRITQSAKVPNGRPFVLTRSSFAGSGRYTYHWTGDNYATFDDLRYSIAEAIDFNTFGIAMVGADLCGFQGESNEELCVRWHQLGAFYPFMRNHNGAGRDQDPASWSFAASTIIRKAIELRYAMLPYFYTLHFRSHTQGATVMRSLMQEFPRDRLTHSIDDQFMIGPSVLVSPIVTQGAQSREAYFPDALWYDGYTGEVVPVHGDWMTLDASFDTIRFHLRGGSILAMQSPARTTHVARQSPFRLLACLDGSARAEGELYWDDGLSSDSFSTGNYTLLSMRLVNGTLTIVATHKGFAAEQLLLDTVVIAGVLRRPTNVVANGSPVAFEYNNDYRVLLVDFEQLRIEMLNAFTLKF